MKEKDAKNVFKKAAVLVTKVSAIIDISREGDGFNADILERVSMVINQALATICPGDVPHEEVVRRAEKVKNELIALQGEEVQPLDALISIMGVVAVSLSRLGEHGTLGEDEDEDEFDIDMLMKEVATGFKRKDKDDA